MSIEKIFYYDKLNRAVSSWLKYGVFKVLGDGHKKKGLIDSNREDIIKLFDLYRQNYKKTSDSRKKKIEKLKKKIIGNIFYDSGSVSLLEGHIRGYHEITSNNAIDAGALGKLKVKWDEIPNIDRMNLRQYRTLKNWGFDVDTLDTIKESEFKDIGIKMINAVLNNKLFTKLSTKYYQLKYAFQMMIKESYVINHSSMYLFYRMNYYPFTLLSVTHLEVF